MSGIPTKHLTDGGWVKSGDYTHHECCDCGLVHIVRYKLKDGELWEQWTTDRPQTRQVRRARKRDLETRQPRRRKGMNHD